MARPFFLLYSLSDSLRSLFFIPTALALTTSLFILFYISSTSNLFTPHLHRHSRLHFLQNPSGLSPNLQSQPQSTLDFDSSTPKLGVTVDHGGDAKPLRSSNGRTVNVFHDHDIFIEDYIKMNESFKIYVYPHPRNHPFANVLLPVDFEPEGNYASESFFKKALNNSHFVTKDPTEADLFYLPFSIARLRHDPRVGIDGIQDFIKDYIFNISHKYPYWNRTGGADHFYVSCHSISRSAVRKAEEIRLNAIQVVCSSSYYVSTKKLAFFAGSMNSPVRERLIKAWQNDTEISVHSGHLNTPYEEALLDSKFCLHVKGFEVNTARIGDALHHGCIPTIIANHYDLPFADILNWKSFSIIIATSDILSLQKILTSISTDEYAQLHNNVLEVRKHFQWHVIPVGFDAFYMVMYELWLRRSSVRVPLS
ncbi:Exostosin-like protein [Cynara cardunculus var. scolymus]|uniref:Exostosin-like protein n=1 Tax=Cynara cardunculus var. scolymus TaxID=59895 RepID=A0A124SBF9_CYNCS|nr:Exostosin-like protein [Cynara cardunculus var. scolymus]